MEVITNGAQQGIEQEPRKVDREDPADSPAVEDAEVVRCIPVVEQNASDEESREYEEEVDATAGDGQEAKERRRGSDLAKKVVPDEHQEDGETADAIQFRNPAALGSEQGGHDGIIATSLQTPQRRPSAVDLRVEAERGVHFGPRLIPVALHFQQKTELEMGGCKGRLVEARL